MLLLKTLCRACLLLAGLLAGYSAQASDYYWIGGSGRWDDLSHWATSSGGSTTYTQVPQNTDNTHFDANSFTASNQTVTIGAIVTCRDMDWTGACTASVSGMRLTGSGIVEVNGNLRLTSGLGRQDANFRMLSSAGSQELDLQAIPINGWLSFESEVGDWTFVSDVNLVQYGASPSLQLIAGSVDFGTVSLSCFGVRSTGSRVRDMYLHASTFNLLAPVNAWEVGGTNLTLNAGTSTLRLGSTPRSTAHAYSFSSSAQAYNTVEIAAQASATLTVGGSTFNTLTVNGNATLTSAATITGTLALGREAILRAAGGQTLTFGSRANLLTSGGCAGLAQLQSSVPGQVATLQRAGSWSNTALAYVAVQDVSFSGGGSVRATNSLNRGNTQGITFTSLPVSDLYWVGGSGNWHDPTHWASASGGLPGSSCLPTLATNVHFDANSFAASGQTVTLDGPNAFCRDLDWTGANAPLFRTAATDLGQKQLGIGGSLLFTASMSVDLKADLVFYGYEAGNPAATLTTAGQTLAGNLFFRAAGSTYSLLDGLTLAPGATSNNGRLYVEAGTLITNGHAIVAQGFTSGYATTGSVFTTGSSANGPVSAAAVTVRLGSSVLTLTPASAATDAGTRTSYTWDVAPGVVLDAGTSTIRIGSNPTRNQPAFFRAGLGLTYNVVAFTDAAAASLPTIVSGGGAGATFNQLTFAGSANISASNTFGQQLGLAAGRIYNFYNSVQRFAPDAQLIASGDCSGYVTINGGTGTARVTFSKPTGGALPNQLLRYVSLRNATFTGGSQWAAEQSFDNNGNTGISFANPPVPRTLYWVGGSGRWTDPAHWALTSDGAAGICIPNQLDDVVFDVSSFTAPGQVVLQDAVLAVCRSLSWATATHNPTFSGGASNRLDIHGSLTWSPAMSQQLLGEIQLLHNGTLTSAGQAFGGGLTINAPNAIITLADALRQPRTGGQGLALTAGTLLTNDQAVQVRSLTSAPEAGTTTIPARALHLGASVVEITAGAWSLTQTQPVSLAFQAGTSTINLSTGTTFNGADFTYNLVQTGAGATHTVAGNSTFARLQLAGMNSITGSNTITQQLILAAGSTNQFGAGTTTTVAPTASVQAIGTGAEVITLQSTVSGQSFIWSKPQGTVCASYIYLRDSQAQGGAYFEAGQNANNQGNTTGWSFASLPQASYYSQQVCPQLGAHALRLTFSGLDRLTQQATTLAAAQFPLTVVLRNITANTTDTLTVPGATYDYLIPTSTAAAQYRVLSVATNSASCTPLINTGLFATVTDAPLSGPAGQWTGAGATADWLDCQNWANGTVPTATTDVVVQASPNAPVLNAARAAVRTLRVQPGAQLTLSSAAELAVSGNWLNYGTTTLAANSLVSFVGSTAQVVAQGNFGRVLVDNSAGLTLQSDATSATSLALRAGTVRTGTYKWIHTNPLGNSLTNSSTSFIAGTLRRWLAMGTTDTYTFPVGMDNLYARLDLLSSQLVGTSYLDASFGPKTDSDDSLRCVDTSPSPLRYVSMCPTGVWLLTPDIQPTGGTYAVRAYLAPFSNLTDNQFGILKRPDASTNAADWSTGGGTLSAADGEGRRVADGYALRSGLSSFSQFGLGQAVPMAPLPVKLTSFRAVAQGTTARLIWTVAQEVGISFYVVERSLDARSFQQVGQVAASGGRTTTYSFLDSFAGQTSGRQVIYYRLRLVEPGTPAGYSPVVTLSYSPVAADLVAWPTVFSTTLHLDGSSLQEDLQQVTLTDARGRLVLTQTLPPGSRVATLNVQGVASGLYLLRATTAHQVYQLRVIRE